LGEGSIDKHLATRRKLEIWSGTAKANEINWAAASDPKPTYNCFGFALGYIQWWEPPLYIDGILANEEAVWPRGISETVQIEAFIEAAKSEGFSESKDAVWQDGVETIMLFFTERDRQFQHAAKQVSPGVWMSKMGFGSDIMHAVDGVDSMQYGKGRIYMKRARNDPSLSS
jgi:hypothetical protein